MRSTKTKCRQQSRKEILGTKDDLSARLIKDRRELILVVQALRDLGHRIVLTMGVFDLLHIGHCRYLRQAKSHGDILVVGVDSDELTRASKGPNRPTVSDILVVRGIKEHPDDLIKQIKPDIWITSNTTKLFDRKVKKRLAKYCGRIVTLDAQATVSTTWRISQLERAGLGKLGRDMIAVLEKHGVIGPAGQEEK
jgi:cytidyltransferase-like protein